jgi:hypothetical protein
MLDPTDFTARNIAKWVARSVVAIKTAEIVTNTTTNNTNFEKDAMIVKIGAGLVGWGVSNALGGLTDVAVDKSADFLTEKWNSRQAAKNDKQDK